MAENFSMMKKTDLDNGFDFGLALKKLRLEKNLSQEELALQSDLDRTYISMLERNLKTPTLGTITKLARSLDVTPLQLVAHSFHSEKKVIHSSLRNNEKFKPPFLGTAVSCGSPVGNDQFVEKEICLDDYAIKNPKKTIFIKASGESMSPTIWSGDLLIIELANKAKSNELVLVQINDEFTVKRLYHSHSKIKLIPDNSNFDEITLNDHLIFQVCGIVKGIFRNFY